MIREVGNRWGRLRARQDELDILLADMHRRRKTRAKLRRARSGEFAARNSMSGGRRAGCYSDQVYRGRASGFQGAEPTGLPPHALVSSWAGRARDLMIIEG